MKKNEIIELNDFEYTLELNRDSFLKIDQYSNIKKSMEVIQKDLYEYVDEIEEDTNPFAEEIDYEKLEEEAEQKLNTLHKIMERAYWIWLYPEHKLSITQVKEILNPYFEDDEKFQWLCDKYGEFMQKCVEIRNEYNENQKNLKAQVNKKY